MNEDIAKVMRSVKDCLTPDLLKPEYRNANASNPMYGHCYVATEALYHVLAVLGLIGDYSPWHGRDDCGITHWWLQAAYGRIDPTVEQYLQNGKSPPYDVGRRGAFLTVKPSKRAEIVIREALKLLGKGGNA
jgi:hypothetical protein